MLIIKQPTDPIQVTNLIVLLYGQPGVRKTSWAFTSSRPLLLDFDNGVHRVAPKYRGAHVRIKKWEDVLGIFDADSDLTDYDTIILDTVGQALAMLTVQIMNANLSLKKADGVLTIQGYGVLGKRFEEFVTKLKTLGKSIVFIAHDKESPRGKGDEVSIRPDITGQTQAMILRMADLCGYISSKNNRATVSFNPTDISYGKNTCGLPAVIELEKAKLSSTIDKAIKNMNDDTEVFRAYQDQLDRIDKVMKIVQTPEELNEAMNSFKGIEFVSDARIITRRLVSDKALEIGAKFDKTLKIYVASDGISS